MGGLDLGLRVGCGIRLSGFEAMMRSCGRALTGT